MPCASTRPLASVTRASAERIRRPRATIDRLGANAPDVRRDRPGEIHLGLDRRIKTAGRQKRHAGAPGRAVDQRQRPAAMHGAHRVQEGFARLALERRRAVADPDQREIERPGHRRRRQLARHDGLQHLLCLSWPQGPWDQRGRSGDPERQAWPSPFRCRYKHCICMEWLATQDPLHAGHSSTTPARRSRPAPSPMRALRLAGSPSS